MGAANPFFFRKRNGEFDLGPLAGDHHLARRVQVRDVHVRLGSEVAHDVFFGPDHRGHRPFGVFARFLHELRALGDERKARFKIKRAGGGMGGEFAQRESGSGDHARQFPTHFLKERREAGRPVNVQRGLAVNRLRQILGWSFEHQLRQRTVQRGVGATEQFGGDGILFGEIFAHANGLCALAGKEECDAFAHDSRSVWLDCRERFRAAGLRLLSGKWPDANLNLWGLGVVRERDAWLLARSK